VDRTLPAHNEDYQSLSDQELLMLIALQRREALETLYERFSGAIYSMAAHMLRDRGAAEEVTQDTFFKVWTRASSFHPDRGKVTSWLFSIAHHRIIDEARRHRRRHQVQVYQDIETIHQQPDDSNDPVRYTMLQLQRGKIKDALVTLSKEQRDVVVLAYYGGLSHSEIAKRLEQPLGTVKTRMRLALKKLRGTLGPQSREWSEHGL
jgi:RNA polymerase sigma-70 factor (ECF subfamily)